MTETARDAAGTTLYPGEGTLELRLNKASGAVSATGY
jgi:hypothetical protein